MGNQGSSAESGSMQSGECQDGISDQSRLAVMLVPLAAVLLGCKAVLLPLPHPAPGDALRWAVRVGVVGAADVAYVLVLGLGLLALLKVAQRLTPRRPGWFWAIAWTAVLASALYGAAGVVIFRNLEMQLTLPTLRFFGEWRQMAAGVHAVVSWQTWLGLAAVLLGTAAACRAGVWCVGRRPVPVSRRGVIVSAALVLAYLGFSFAWSRTQWQDSSLWQARLARSPHLRLLESLVAAAPAMHAAALPDDSPEFDDFRPAGTPPEGDSPIFASRKLGQSPVASRKSGQFPGPKNIVLVVFESVGAEYMGLYGAPYDNTPNLERLAEHGLVFENVYAQCPSSAKALVAMLSGVYPRMDWREETRSQNAQLPSLADAVRRQGYRTAFFHSGDWSWQGGDAFLEQHGFDRVRDARHLPQQACSWGQYDSWLQDQLLTWIDRDESPFLAVVWTIQTHHPYTVEGEVRDYGVDDPELNRYLNAVRESDALVGRIWQAICNRHLAESTVLAVVGDHGEAFGQHNQRLHIFGLYEENVRVPLVIVHADPRLPVGRRETIAEQIDLPATLAECAGVPGEPAWQGRNLLSADRHGRAYFYVVWDPVLFGVRQGRYKYILEPGRRDAMYDLAADPGETEDVAARHPDLRDELKRRLHVLVAYQDRQQESHDRGERSNSTDSRRLTAAGAVR
jgi:arylsulfatase A-like enzyme